MEEEDLKYKLQQYSVVVLIDYLKMVWDIEPIRAKLISEELTSRLAERIEEDAKSKSR